MKILVTGAAGFIGTNLVLELLSQGHRVIGVDSFFSSSRERLKLFEDLENFEFLEHNVIYPFDPGSIDYVFNLASPASPPRYESDPIYTLKTNFIGSLNSLEIAKKYNAGFLQASTSEVYGDPEVRIQSESYWGHVNPIGPRSCYDEGKRVAESLCVNYHLSYNMPVKIIRIFNTYGPYMDADDGRVVSNFINAALLNRDITIYGKGIQTRSFQYISDLVEAIIKVAFETKSNFIGPINLGNPEEFNMLELAEHVLSLIPKSKSKIVYKPLPVDDPELRKPDINLAKKILNWEPKVRLDQGLKNTIDYFQEQL